MNKRKKYSPEEIAKIVLEVLREDNTLVEISNKYEVSQQLISYLATMEASKKWTMPIKDWRSCLSQLVIHFEDRISLTALAR